MIKLANDGQPYAITMWDFSWLERRWPGAGYEDWDRALDELAERGYNAVRLDAYPHLHAIDPQREWTILPCWNQQDWGSASRNRVAIQPALNVFLEKCAARGIKVGLSSWYQDDTTHARQLITTPEVHGQQWVGVIDAIASAGLLDTVLYVDLCNEWPFTCWAPFFNYPTGGPDETFAGQRSLAWMQRAIETIKAHYAIPTTFSIVGVPRQADRSVLPLDLPYFDFWEPHIWMVHANRDEFYQRVGYSYPRWDSTGYERVAEFAEALYRQSPDYWLNMLRGLVNEAADFSRTVQRPLITTECWGIVDYKDWPLLDWGWVKESCAVGTETAAASGRWAAIATSNFCGPQFVGMWRDIAWHQRLTGIIKSSPSTVL